MQHLRILHPHWLDGALWLWAEDGDAEAPAPPRSRARLPRPRPHPFALGAEALADLLPGVEAAPDSLVVLLPTAVGLPAASPGLLRDGPPAARTAPTLAPWQVPALRLSTAASLDALLSIPALPPGQAWGEGMPVLAALARMALELVAQGRVVARLEPQWDRGAGRGRPGPLDLDHARELGALVGALPPLSRAAWPASTQADHQRAAHGGGWAELELPTERTLLRGALADLVDQAARDALSPPPRLRGREALPASEAWLRALRSPDPALVGANDQEVALLAKYLGQWLDGQEALQDSALRLCLRVTEPEDDDGPWPVDFLLEAVDDPSLRVPLTALWGAEPEAVAALTARRALPEEFALAELGRALRLWPALEPALRSPTPTGFGLDLDDAWDFLRASAPLLEQAGFGLLLPAWWSGKAVGLGLRARARAASAAHESTGLLNTDGLFDLDWSAVVGDEQLDLDELRRLSALKAPLVRLRGTWVQLHHDQLREAVSFLERRGLRRPVGAIELLRMGLGVDDTPGGLPVVDLQAEGELGDLLTGARRLAELQTPAGFGGELRPYQRRGLAWMHFLEGAGLGACLADDMGLGKTVQVLALLQHERAEQRELGPTLLVCPLSVVDNWRREAERFAPTLDVHVHHGPTRLRGDELQQRVKTADLVITTYQLVARDVDDLQATRWRRVALDEAQNIKNAETKQSRAVSSLDAARRLALTGTPVENRLSELWSILTFLNPGLLGSAADFRRRFSIPVERYGDAGSAALLRRLTQPFVLRRLKTDRTIIADLPDKIEVKERCHLTREQASLYAAIAEDMMQRAEQEEGMKRRGLILAAMTKLKQVCNHPAHLLQDGSEMPGRSWKLRRLEELLEAVLDADERALVFTQFAEMGHLLQRHLRRRFGREVLFLHGGVSKKQRDAMIERFGQAEGPPIFLLSLKAGGTGLNLVAANHVIHYDRWWNPAVENQATDRAYRIGQTRNVQVRKLVCTGTLEERIDAMLEAKQALADQVVGAGEGWLTELSTAELRSVIALSTDAVLEA